MKKMWFLAILALVCSSELSWGAEEPVAKAAGTSQPQAQAAKRLARPNFSILSGSVVKVDNSDPTKPKIEIKNDADGKVSAVELTPFTNVMKATDVTEMKSGDAVRVMTRKTENKDVAINVMFGKLRKLPTRENRANQAMTEKAAPPTAKK